MFVCQVAFVKFLTSSMHCVNYPLSSPLFWRSFSSSSLVKPFTMCALPAGTSLVKWR